MLSKRQQLLILCSVLGGIVVIGLLATSFKKAEAPAPVTETVSSTEPAPSPTEKPEKTPSTTPPKKTTTPTPVQTYDQLVESYKASGYRFQFSSCSGSPGTLAIKVGMKYMLDNRDATAHVIKVGSKSYNIGAYGYTIATASTLGTLNITCDGRGSATLVVQP